MAIEPVQIATNRNASVEAQAINLYNTDYADNLTLGQLMSAVCLRAGAFLEARSIRKMNEMDKGTAQIDELSALMERLSREEVDPTDWAILRNRIEDRYGLTSLPATIASYADRLAAITALKTRLDQVTQASQEDMIDLQSYVTARDVAFTTSTNLVHSIQNSAKRIAETLR